MADLDVQAKISVDTDSAIKQTLLLKDSIKQLQKEFNDAKAGSNEQVAALKKLQAAQKDLEEANKSLEQTTQKSKGTFGTLKEGLMGSVPAFKTAGEGADSLKKKFLELLANPLLLMIAAIVAALKFLYDSFTNTSEGSKKMEQVWAGLSATVNQLKDMVFALGRAWMDSAKALFSVYEAAYKFITLDFKGASKAIDEAKEHAKDAVNDVKEAGGKMNAALSGETAKTVMDITKKLQDIKKEERLDDEDKAKRAKELALLREKLNDDSIPIAERKKAALALRADEEKNAVEDLDRAKRKTALKIQLLTIEKDGEKKNAEEISKLKIEIEQTEKENALEKVRTNKVIRNLEKQETAEATSAQKEANEKRKEEQIRLHEYLNRLEKIKQENELANITDAYLKERKQLENKIADEERQITESYQAGKLKLEEYNNLRAALKAKSDAEIKALDDKHKKELEKSEADFQDKIAAIRNETRLASIKDERAKEMETLEDSYVQKRAAVDKDEKLSTAQKIQLKEELLTQERVKIQQLLDKFEADDKRKAKEKQDKQNELAQQVKEGGMSPEQLEYIKLEQAYIKKFELAEGNEILLTDLKRRYNEERQKLDDLHHQQQLESVSGTLGKVAEVVGKQTAAGKGLAVAEATINTLVAGTNALKAIKTAKSPIEALAGIATMATVIASGFKTVKQIVSVPVPGSGGGSTPSVPTPISPQQTSTALNSASIQGIGNAAGGVNRSFVLSTDIKNDAERQATLNRAARLA